MARKNTKKSRKSVALSQIKGQSRHIVAKDVDEVDEQVKEIFEQAQTLDYGSNDYLRKLESYTDRSPVLSGGDPDASWESADAGEETVGGENPTPDQSVVGEAGEAMGITYNDEEPLRTAEKLADRDRHPWELNPASAAEGHGRTNEGQLALKRLIEEQGVEVE